MISVPSTPRPLGPGADGELLVGLEADGEELIECRAVLAQHARARHNGHRPVQHASPTRCRSTIGRLSSPSIINIACTSLRSLTGSSI